MPLSDAAREALRRYQDNLQASRPQTAAYDPSAGLGLEAAHLVPAALLEAAVQAESLVVVPHGPLHLLPWAGLVFEGKRLFEYCPVGLVPNLSCLLSLETAFAASPRIGLIGAPDYEGLAALAPLDYAPEELQTAQDIYGTQCVGEVVMGAEATETAFWQLAHHEDAPGGILHLACHGNFVTGDPMNSGLLFTDAKIDAAEIARTQLQYDEVILSACSTGYRPTEVQGVSLSGDDVVGLPGAFLEAGVRSVLVSIPRARDDAALQFMTIYHEQRAFGETPLAALQETQKTMLGGYLSPEFWIGFTVYGCG